MPRLQILQHKSYHPYLEKNKQRVREDEAKAAAAELEQEQKRIDKDSTARLDYLRRRAGSPTFAVDPSAATGLSTGLEEDILPSTSTHNDKGESLLERHRKKKAQEEKRERKKRERLDFDFPKPEDGRDEWTRKRDDDGNGDWRWDKNGHINFFTDLEQPDEDKERPTLTERAKKKQKEKEDPFTMYLARPERETKPWYTDKEFKRVEDKETGEEAEQRRARDKRKDVRSKHRHDPLSLVDSLLSSQPKPHPSTNNRPSIGRQAERGMSERERAMAMLAQSKGGSQKWDDTPSSVGGTWGDRLEREKDRAGRFFAKTETPRWGGKSWEV
ncbi:hypothetical protein M231_06626 [Tremella mesenterica]|uniref:CBF1-interacting co-repressor CIR N-terminal domain-containing protein n=1 Tax=Tremella mesenterica TaxID=5217 RepID=A0A4Q1BF16_TREME|nr:hypothetical protein M231_06626 [Tremella mesenterica]